MAIGEDIVRAVNDLLAFLNSTDRVGGSLIFVKMAAREEKRYNEETKIKFVEVAPPLRCAEG